MGTVTNHYSRIRSPNIDIEIDLMIVMNFLQRQTVRERGHTSPALMLKMELTVCGFAKRTFPIDNAIKYISQLSEVLVEAPKGKFMERCLDRAF